MLLPAQLVGRGGKGRQLGYGPRGSPRTGRIIVPAYLTERDYPWLRILLDEYGRFLGRRRRDWQERLLEPLGAGVPRYKLNLAVQVLEAVTSDRVAAQVAPRKVRQTVFRETAGANDPSAALGRAAAQLGLSPAAIPSLLFADLPDERELTGLSEPLSPAQLAVHANAALIARLLHNAAGVRVSAHGQVRALVRHIKLTGLVSCAVPGPVKDQIDFVISGPYALFRHTRVYGRALASLVPRLAWCQSYRLEAECVINREGETARLVIRAGDPIAAARELERFDSRVEQRFAEQFGRAAPDWELIREPNAVPVGKALMFPDFELRRRLCPEDRWLLEIIGYWTPQYLAKKLALLRAAGLGRFIICIDEDRRCAEGEMPPGARIVRYRRKVDASAVLAVVNSGAEPSR